MAVSIRDYLKQHWLGLTVGNMGIVLAIVYLLGEYLIYGEELFEHFGRDIFHVILILFTLPLFAAVGWLLDRKVMLERESRKSEEKFRELFENAYDLIFTLDLKGNLTSANRAACKLSGYSDEELRRLNIAQLLPPELHRIATMRITRIAAGETKSPHEYEFIKKDGSMATIEISSRAIMAEGKPAGIHCVARDITENVKLQKKIAESERYLNNIIESSADAIIALDTGGNVMLFNEGAERIFGYRAVEVIGKNIVENNNVKFYKDTDSARQIMNMLKESPEGRISSIEVEGIAKNGRQIFLMVSASVLKDEKGNVIGSLGIHRDVTERRRAEEEIKRNYEVQTAINSLLQISLGNIPLDELLKRALDLLLSIPWLAFESRGGIFLVEDEPQVLVLKVQNGLTEPIQKSCERIQFGRCLCGKAALKQEIQFASHIDERHEIMYWDMYPHGHFCVPILSGSNVLGVINLYLKEGHRYDRREEEFLYAVAGVLAGIIERRKAEQQLQTAYAELKELHERKMDFTNMAAHELRTPLVPIVGYLGMLKDEIQDEKLLGYIEIMERNAERQRRLIDSMLELSRLDNGKVELNYSDVNVSVPLRWLLEDYALTGRKFTVNVPENFVIRADEGKLFQILDNLISNAVKYSSAETEIKICMEERSHDYLITVSDQGEGIPQEDQKRIFERFYIVGGNKLTRSVHRIGLGLTLARGYVELHGGKIWVESEPGKGSTFYFTIPRMAKPVDQKQIIRVIS